MGRAASLHAQTVGVVVWGEGGALSSVKCWSWGRWQVGRNDAACAVGVRGVKIVHCTHSAAVFANNIPHQQGRVAGEWETAAAQLAGRAAARRA